MMASAQYAGDVLAAIIFWLVALLHIAVLRDGSICEPHAFESMRRVRVGAWAIVGVMAWHGIDLWVLPVMALALCDAISAAGRLWDMGHGNAASHATKES